MEEFITAHTGKIIGFIVAGFLGVVGWLIRDAKKETKQDARLDDLESTRDTLRDCLPQMKSDLQELKTAKAVDRAVIERIEKNVDKILEKLEGK